jgi:protein TonB
LISHNIKWFLGLSVAVHTAALVSWSPSEHAPGHSGQVLLLAVSNRTGEAVVQQQDLTASHSQSAPEQTLLRQPAAPLPENTAAPVRQQSVEPPAVRLPVEAPALAQEHTERSWHPAPATQAASTTLSREQQEQHLRASVMDFITQRLSYPAIARRKGWQGVVKLELHIEPDGLISDLHIDETSGYAVLDEAALQSLQLANIPNAAQWLHGETANIIIPVEYRLIDG